MIKLMFTCIIVLETGFVTSISVIQSERLQMFVPGQTVTLSCHVYEFIGNNFYWFKQSLGEGPTCIVNQFRDSHPVFYGLFTNDKRLNTKMSEHLFTLTISNAELNDTGMYFCAVRDYDDIVFGNGVLLRYTDLRHHHYIKEVVAQDQENLKESLYTGDNVTLQCTIAATSCAGEHSVFWIRPGSGESHPGILYTDGDSSGQCKNRSDAGSSTQCCIYSLPKKNLRTSDAGTYYCAVATCGEILFGNGIKLAIQGEEDELIQMQQIIFGLAIFIGFFLIVILILMCALVRKRNMARSVTERKVTIPEPSFSIDETVETEDLKYAAIKFAVKKSKRNTQRDSYKTVIYSDVRGSS